MAKAGAAHHREPLSGHRAKTPLATPLGEAPLHGQRGPASPLPGLREPHHDRPPTGQMGRPSLATLPPFGRPTGAYGHRLPHWPPTGHLLAIRGGLPLAKGEAPTGHLLPLPHQPIEAFGREGQKKAGLPTLHRLTDWPPTPPPLAIPALPRLSGAVA